MLGKEKKYLFLVVLGGRAKMANVELHDVRWAIGSRIEDTYDVLKNDWFGISEGLHIDSYKKINYVDGYKINIRNIENNKYRNNKFREENPKKNNLYFVNIGGYDPTSMQEKHEFGLIVALSKLEAKNKAKSNWLIGCKEKHKDDIVSLKTLIGCDDCQVIHKIGKWEIELIMDENSIKETKNPDWYGYKRIDNI